MTFTDARRISISDPGELIEAIPYLLGFHPRESLVLLGFESTDPVRPMTGTVQVALRVDLPPDVSEPIDIEPLIETMRGSGASAVAAMIHSADVGDPAGKWTALADAVSTAVAVADMALVDFLLSDDSRWWSLICADPRCCPPTGRARAVGCSKAAAQATLAGLVALPDREALEAQLDGDTELTRRKLQPHLEQAEHRVTRAVLSNGVGRLTRADATALKKACRDKAATAARQAKLLTPEQLARFGVALSDIDVRDELWLAVDDQSLDAGQLMHELLTRLPAPYDAAPLFLYGWHQWRAGNGTLAAVAAERALESDRGYSAARLLLQAVRSGLDPHKTPYLRDPVADTRTVPGG
ncbi:MAG: hypothetical protein JWN47_703 [Frankiales bacterium]|nr:hypothetical protein [Frankiales bacterium]